MIITWILNLIYWVSIGIGKFKIDKVGSSILNSTGVPSGFV